MSRNRYRKNLVPKKVPVSVSKIFGTGKKYRYRLTFWIPSHTAVWTTLCEYFFFAVLWYSGSPGHKSTHSYVLGLRQVCPCLFWQTLRIIGGCQCQCRWILGKLAFEEHQRRGSKIYWRQPIISRKDSMRELTLLVSISTYIVKYMLSWISPDKTFGDQNFLLGVSLSLSLSLLDFGQMGRWIGSRGDSKI